MGLALAALVDRSEGKNKAALAALAVEQLDAFLARAAPAARDYTKARLYATRLRPLAAEGTPGGIVSVSPQMPHGRSEGGAAMVMRPVLVEAVGKRVVYVLDSSGSMMNKFETLRRLMRQAVDSLQRNQQFAIIFFSEDKFLALDRELLPAVPETKRKAYDFLDKTAPHGSSDPIPALQVAFRGNPDTVFLLTDGDFPNNDQVIQELRRLNKDKRVKINTIAFMDRGEAYERLLRQIADETGGTFRFVSQTDGVEAR
jgi:Mg-chelatase subunit ChlD